MLLVSHTTEPRAMHRAIVLAGLAGAMAEVICVALFCALTPLNGGEVLRQITASVFLTMSGSAWAPVLGLLLHFALGVAVAYAFGLLIWQTFARRMGAATTLGTALLALAAIWTFNFFVLLPVVNAEFIGLMPYAVTFVSKVLFGVAMAATLNSFALESRTSTDTIPATRRLLRRDFASPMPENGGMRRFAAPPALYWFGIACR
jgi:hypothetical protein